MGQYQVKEKGVITVKKVNEKSKKSEKQVDYARFDAMCLNADEQKRMKELDENEKRADKESKKQAGKFAYNSAKSMVGGAIGAPMGAIGAVNSAHKYNKAQDEKNKITEERDEIRQQAQDRYEKATGLRVEEALDDKGKGEMNYG